MNQKRYILSSVVLIVLDLLWIRFYMRFHYARQIGKIQKFPLKANLLGVVLAYSLMILGLCVFVLPRVHPEKYMTDSIKYGALFGLVVYGIFDFTNMAVFNDWEPYLAIVDVVWGMFVYVMATLVGNRLAIKPRR